MGELLRRFYDIWRASILEGVRPVYFRGGEPIAQAMQALGMELEQPKGETRIEFLSPNRGAFSGAWIEKLPESGEAIQRVFAALFQGLVPGSPFVVLHKASDSRALLAWLRQAGFEAQTEAKGGEHFAILSIRIGA